MPSLVDLQATQVLDGVTWEAVLVDRAADANLSKLEQKALEMAVKARSESEVFIGSDLVRKLAVLVSDYMGGSVADPDKLSRSWRRLGYSLKATLGSMVLPLGSLTIGLSRHRALMFKVLAPMFIYDFYTNYTYSKIATPQIQQNLVEWALHHMAQKFNLQVISSVLVRCLYTLSYFYSSRCGFGLSQSTPFKDTTTSFPHITNWPKINS